MVSYGQSKKDLIILQQQTIDSLKVVVDSAAADLQNCQKQMIALDANIDRKEVEAARTLQRMDSLKSHSLKLEEEVSRLTLREHERRNPQPVVDISNAAACKSYLMGKVFVGKNWDGDVYLTFGFSGAVSVSKEVCGEWEHKQIPKLGGTLIIDTDMGLLKHARKVHFGPDSWALLCGDGNLIWSKADESYGTMTYLVPDVDVLSRTDRTIEIEGMFLDACYLPDVENFLDFNIQTPNGIVKMGFRDYAHTGTEPLYEANEPTMGLIAPNPAAIGKWFVLSIARDVGVGEYTDENPEPESFPVDVIVGIRPLE